MNLEEMLDKMVMHYNIGKFESLSYTGQLPQSYGKRKERTMIKIRKVIDGLGYDREDVAKLLNNEWIEENSFENVANVTVGGNKKVCVKCGEYTDDFHINASWCKECLAFWGWADRFVEDKKKIAEFKEHINDYVKDDGEHTSYIYFFRVEIDGEEMFKIGKARLPYKRIEQVEKAYEQATGKTIKHELVSVIKHSEDSYFGSECVKLEKYIHKLYRDSNVVLPKFDGSKEYFYITDNDVEEIHKLLGKEIYKEVERWN